MSKWKVIEYRDNQGQVMDRTIYEADQDEQTGVEDCKAYTDVFDNEDEARAYFAAAEGEQ